MEYTLKNQRSTRLNMEPTLLINQKLEVTLTKDQASGLDLTLGKEIPVDSRCESTEKVVRN